MGKIKVEAEGGELILKNKKGDHVIIPKKYRREVQDMIKDNCNGCIDGLVETLPIMSDYAADGTIVPGEDEIKKSSMPNIMTVGAKPPIETTKMIEDRFNKQNNLLISDLLFDKKNPKDSKDELEKNKIKENKMDKPIDVNKNHNNEEVVESLVDDELDTSLKDKLEIDQDLKKISKN